LYQHIEATVRIPKS